MINETKTQDSINLENLEALDLGEKGQDIREQTIDQQIDGKKEVELLPHTGELGGQVLSWYENYALPHQHDTILGKNKADFNWNLSSEGRSVSLGELDQYIAQLFRESQTLRGEKIAEDLAQVDESAQTANEAGALSSTERRDQALEALDIRLLDALTERFLAELAFMTLCAKELKQAVVEAEVAADSEKLKVAGEGLKGVFREINLFLLAAKNDLKFNQGEFFDRYRSFKKEQKATQKQDYQTDLREWQMRFEQTIKGSNYQIKEQTQTLEGTFLSAIEELDYLINGDGLGEGGIARALELIEEKLNSSPVTETKEPQSPAEQEVPQSDKVATNLDDQPQSEKKTIIQQLEKGWQDHGIQEENQARETPPSPINEVQADQAATTEIPAPTANSGETNTSTNETDSSIWASNQQLEKDNSQN